MQEFRSSRQILCQVSVRGALKSGCELLVASISQSLCCCNGGSVKLVGDVDPAIGDQGPHLGVRVRLSWVRDGHIPIGVFGPQGAKNQDRSSTRVRHEGGKCCRQAFAESMTCT